MTELNDAGYELLAIGPPRTSVADGSPDPAVAVGSGKVTRRTVLGRIRGLTVTTLAEFGALLLLVAVWQFWVWGANVDPLVMPAPASVIGDILAEPGAYLPQALATLRSALAGLALGLVLGIGLAILSWWSAILRGVIAPPVMIVRSVPMMAMIPIFARIVGYNVWTVVVVSTLVAYFPAYILTLSGLSSSTTSSADLFAVLGSRRREVLRHLALPAAVPNMLTALRLSSVACIVGALIAEYVASSDGLGYLFIRTRLDYQITRSWGVALTATLLSVVMFGIASSVEKIGRRRMQ